MNLTLFPGDAVLSIPNDMPSSVKGYRYGSIYLIDFDSRSKLGFSRLPKSRILSLIGNEARYGEGAKPVRIWVSDPLEKPLEVERAALTHFNANRRNAGEMIVGVGADVIAEWLSQYPAKHAPDLFDLAEKLEQDRQSESALQSLKKLLFPNFNPSPEPGEWIPANMTQAIEELRAANREIDFYEAERAGLYHQIEQLKKQLS